MIIRMQKNDSLFCLVYLLWFASDLINRTNIPKILGVPVRTIDTSVNYIVLAGVFLYIVFGQVYEKIEVRKLIYISLPVVISTILSKDFRIISLTLFIIAARNIDIERLVLGIYKVLWGVLLTVFLLYRFNIIKETIMYRHGVIRHSFGFMHPNGLGSMVFQLIICYVFLNQGNAFKQYLFTLVGALFIYIVPNSQSPMILSLILLFLLAVYYLIKRNEQSLNVFSVVLIIIAIACNIFCIYSMIFGYSLSGNPVLAQINRILSFRLTSNYQAYRESGVSLWGQPVFSDAVMRAKMGLKGHLYLDSAYATLIIRYGVVVYVLFSGSYYIAMLYRMKYKDYFAVLLMFIFTVYGLMETNWFGIRDNFTLFFLSSVLYTNNVLTRKDSEKKNNGKKNRTIYRIRFN